MEEVLKQIGFIEDYPAFAGFSSRAIRPLIREQDPEIKQKIITNAGKLNDENRLARYGTEPKMKKAIARYKEVETEEPKKKTPKKLWSKFEQAEYAQEVVRTFIANGVDPAVIRELIVKAIGVVEQE
jgi:hypothetical protein